MDREAQWATVHGIGHNWGDLVHTREVDSCCYSAKTNIPCSFSERCVKANYQLNEISQRISIDDTSAPTPGKNEYLSQNLILHEETSVQLKTVSNFLFK